ncbi:MAG TPA: SDR family oxidoreductase [Opitutaceae bacterium]|nr:SDR family oxidoreductase [Opitutaceae bacterium]
MKIVLTGATRGLGLALAERWIAEHHTVIGCGRSAHEVTRLRAKHPAPQDFTVVDVADDGAVEEWARHVLEAHGPPDLLINNAALMNRPAKLWEVPAHEFSRLIDVNIKGVANVIRHFVPAMVRHGSGVIVNLSSGWGRSTSPEVAPYCASKYAIEGLTQALAQELPPGLAAVPLNPGIINTEMLQQAFGPDAASYPRAHEWAVRAAPFILKLGPKDNGRPLSVPGVPHD